MELHFSAMTIHVKCGFSFYDNLEVYYGYMKEKILTKYFIRKIRMLFITSLLLAVSASLSYAAFFSDSFETGDFTHRGNGVYWSDQTASNMTISSDRAHTGTYSAKFHYTATPIGGDSWSELRFNLGAKKTEIYLSYYIWFPSNFVVRNDPPTNNKFIMIWGDNYNDQAGFGMQFSYSSSGPMFQMTQPIVYDSLTDRMVPKCSGAWGDFGPNFTLGSSYFGKWTKIVIHSKIDSGVGDGALEIWVDDVRKISLTNFSIPGSPCFPGYYRNGYLMGWANSGYSEDTDIYIDDVVFSDTYIGLTDTPFHTPLPPTVKKIPQ